MRESLLDKNNKAINIFKFGSYLQRKTVPLSAASGFRALCLIAAHPEKKEEISFTRSVQQRRKINTILEEYGGQSDLLVTVTGWYSQRKRFWPLKCVNCNLGATHQKFA
jgi:hypothetical protein